MLSASTIEYEDAVARVHDLRRRYTLSTPPAAECFGLGRGFLGLPPDRPEEFAATLTCGDYWTLSVGTCAVSVPSPSNYEGLVAGLLASSDPALGPHVDFAERTLGSLEGEELLVELLGEQLPVYQATWRDPGRVRDPGHPEIELELTLRGLDLDAARDEWHRVIESLRLVREYGAP